MTSQGKEPVRWRGLRLYALPSLTVGILVAAILPSQKTFELRLEAVAGSTDAETTALLLSTLRAAQAETGQPGLVDAPVPSCVRAVMTTIDRAAGNKSLTVTADRFLAALQVLSQKLRADRSPLETVLLDQSARLRGRLNEAQQKLDSTSAALPPSDPRVNREALRLRWAALRADWASSSGVAQQAAEEIERLRFAPDLTAGVVAEEDRRAALEADAALQQDLKELNVRLTEMKLHLLQVWQLSAGRLEQLSKEAEAFKTTLAGIDTSKFSANLKAGLDALRVTLDAYSVTLAAFQNAWTTEFNSVKLLEIDPQDPVLIDLQERVRKLLGDFLFKGSKQLGDLRQQLGDAENTDSASARHHVLESTLTRGFQTVQTAHHRFEFAASMIETPENFRLDAALRSARGLHRRSREQTQFIEKRLELEAATRAKADRQRALAEAAETIEQLRVDSLRTVTELFNVQDGLLAAGIETQDFLLAALRVEVVAQTVQAMQRDLSELESRRQELESARLEQANQLAVKQTPIELVGTDYQWGMRVRVGVAAGVLSFLAVLVFRRQAAH